MHTHIMYEAHISHAGLWLAAPGLVSTEMYLRWSVCAHTATVMLPPALTHCSVLSCHQILKLNCVSLSTSVAGPAGREVREWGRGRGVTRNRCPLAHYTFRHTPAELLVHVHVHQMTLTGLLSACPRCT